MDWQGALRARMVAAAPTVEGRVYWGDRPQGKPLPDITLQTISAPREYHLQGAQNVQWVRVQADCRALSFAASLETARALIAEMEQPKTLNGVKFLAAIVEGPTDRGERTETAFIHRQQTDFMFFYSNA